MTNRSARRPRRADGSRNVAGPRRGDRPRRPRPRPPHTQRTRDEGRGKDSGEARRKTNGKINIMESLSCYRRRCHCQEIERTRERVVLPRRIGRYIPLEHTGSCHDCCDGNRKHSGSNLATDLLRGRNLQTNSQRQARQDSGAAFFSADNEMAKRDGRKIEVF